MHGYPAFSILHSFLDTRVKYTQTQNNSQIKIHIKTSLFWLPHNSVIQKLLFPLVVGGKLESKEE